MNCSTIYAILKNMNKIMEHVNSILCIANCVCLLVPRQCLLNKLEQTLGTELIRMLGTYCFSCFVMNIMSEID